MWQKKYRELTRIYRSKALKADIVYAPRQRSTRGKSIGGKICRTVQCLGCCLPRGAKSNCVNGYRTVLPNGGNDDGVSTSEELQRLDDLGIESISLTSDGNHQVLADGSVIEHGQFLVTYTDGRTGVGANVAFEYRDDVHSQDHTVDPRGGALL